MKQLRDFSDDRYKGYCVLCGGEPETRDHVPSKVFLDRPYPEQLPVVPTCDKCNNQLSLDEEYVACVIECVIAGSCDPETLTRNKIGRILTEKPEFQKQLSNSMNVYDNQCCKFTFRKERVSRVCLKLARGHISYELGIVHSEIPTNTFWKPVNCFSEDELRCFDSPSQLSVWPEVGSRSLQRAVSGFDLDSKGWITVQPDLYRYRVFQDNGEIVQIILREYLACMVVWK